jgi:hypothetical protein
LVGWARSTSADDAEQAAREAYRIWAGAMTDRFEATADPVRRAEADGRDWARVNIVVRDSYLAIGRSADEAMEALRRLNDASRDSAEAVGRALEPIMKAMAEMEADQQRLTDAIQRYGFTFEELGEQFRQTELHKQATELIEDWRVLVGSGINLELVNSRMAGAMNEYLQSALLVGAEVPAAMRPVLQSLADQGLLFDQNGGMIADLGAAGISWAETMTEGFDRVIAKLDQLLTGLIAAGTAVQGLDPALTAPVRANDLTERREARRAELWSQLRGAAPVAHINDAIENALRMEGLYDVPSYAQQGVVTRPTLAMIGDASEPEYVLHESTVARLASGRGRGDIVFNIERVETNDPEQFLDQLKTHVRRNRRNIRADLTKMLVPRTV